MRPDPISTEEAILIGVLIRCGMNEVLLRQSLQRKGGLSRKRMLLRKPYDKLIPKNRKPVTVPSPRLCPKTAVDGASATSLRFLPP